MVENLSLPEELQKLLDQRIGMNMVGDMGRYTQFQVAQSIPMAAANEGGLAGAGAGSAAGFGMAQAMTNAMRPPEPSAPQGANQPLPMPPVNPERIVGWQPEHGRTSESGRCRSYRRSQILHELRQADPEASPLLPGVRRHSGVSRRKTGKGRRGERKTFFACA